MTASTTRRFRPSEGDEGEQKEVVITLRVEKVEVDKNALKLRLAGKILSGRPAEYVRMGSYHTLNIGADDTLEITKEEWKDYVLSMVKQAVLDSRKPKLGVVALDDEKATFAYVKGYGIEVVTEIYSKLSKRMKSADYEKARSDYFGAIIKQVNSMKIDLVVIAGPGFTKDDLKKYSDEKLKIEKRVVYTSASDAERSGVREALQSEAAAKLLENDKVKREFDLLNMFLSGLSLGASFFGVEKVKDALESYQAGAILVNDSVLNDLSVKDALDLAYRQNAQIYVFNSEDDAGMQLSNFKNVAAIGKSFMRRSE